MNRTIALAGAHAPGHVGRVLRARWLKPALLAGAAALLLGGCHYYGPYYDGPAYGPGYVAPPASIHIGPGYRHRSGWRHRGHRHRRWRRY